MKTKEYKTVDKSDWLRGPWDDEPDKMQFQDEATGYPCLIVRNMAGALCGYVGVPSSHPAHAKGYEGVDVSVHGGLTFAGFCSPSSDESHTICHVVEDGEDDKVWWLGFDCAHCYDLSPAMEATLRKIGHRDTSFMSADIYRDLAYVKGQIAGLAKQLKGMEK